ncbi:PTS transporter subunit EIIC [Bacillus pacificus]
MIIKMPETVPPAVTRSFAALIPGFIVVTVVWIIRLIFEHTTFGSIHNVGREATARTAEYTWC